MSVTIREPGSALTHFIGIVMTVALAFPLLLRAAASGSQTALITCAIFMGSMLLLYTASTVFHTVNAHGHLFRALQKCDHAMIFVLIAGSYAPFCLLVVGGAQGKRLFIIVCALALCGILFKLIWITCPKWVSSVLYIGLGWACMAVAPALVHRLPRTGFFFLLLGGILYTVGGIIYALRLPLFKERKYFGNHELFHLFVLGGSLCHIVSVSLYLR